MKPIYEPKGKAKEYGDFAINIYTGCPHRCYYCFAPNVLHRDREHFHGHVAPREGIIDAVKLQLEREHITDKTIHLCFTCDPYPIGCDTTATREIIKAIKETGNHVQILTKNGKDALRDFDLLDENDWFGVTYAGYDGHTHLDDYIPAAEPNSGPPHWRIKALYTAWKQGIKTWVSCEPVLNAVDVLNFIECADYVNLWKIGKLNYYSSNINWKDFGIRAERALIVKKRWRNDVDYYIKESLRKEMDKEI